MRDAPSRTFPPTGRRACREPVRAAATTGRPGGAPPPADELAEISRSFESKPASAVVKWAYDRFGDGLVLAASFQDCVLIDVAVQAVPDIEVVFLDTQYHFAETLWYVEQVRARYDLNLTVMRPKATLDDLWHNDPDQCCRVRKVEPLERALQGRAAWMTGLRRDEAREPGDRADRRATTAAAAW